MGLPDVLSFVTGPVMALASGALLGAIFFGGLWWTVRHAATFRQPGASVFASWLLRMGITLVGFYVVADGQWQRMLLCLLGFTLARVSVMRLTRRALPA